MVSLAFFPKQVDVQNADPASTLARALLITSPRSAERVEGVAGPGRLASHGQ